MREIKTSRSALGLYGTLLVLPTLVFGWMYWSEIKSEYEAELADVPKEANDVARRIVSAMDEQLGKLIEAEASREFIDYADYIIPSGALGDDIRFDRSPISLGQPPTGILAWFRFDRKAGPLGSVEVFAGEASFTRQGVSEKFERIIEDFRKRKVSDDYLRRVPENDGPLSRFPLMSVALYMAGPDIECVAQCQEYMAGRMLTARVSKFGLQFYLDDDGVPRAIASRRIHATLGPLNELPPEAKCLAPLAKGFWLQQGFLIDVNWLFKELPFQIEEHVLDAHQSLRRPDNAGTIDKLGTIFASIDPVRELGFETFESRDALWGRLEVEINTKDIDARFENHARNVLAGAFMLVLTLATGMTLLYRSVNRELEHAHRMQNFVAAVTHELRTPISTIRVHGEMLADGWVTDPEKQDEYYKRIVRETGRLSTLVENVLEKSRLKESVSEPIAGSLNTMVRAVCDDLVASDAVSDLDVKLAPRLPDVWLTSEGVTGILTNLVENARKYAPVDVADPKAERIQVRTRWDGERALLEVADRGPGVPKAEREAIFEAFYRVGSEATRTATGTGLGLHLVRLHANAAGAVASVHEREGGGSIFRVAWRAVT